MSKSKSPAPAKFVPTWEGPIQGYVVNFITREGWRTAATQERSDLMQEAWLIFMRCCDKYPDVVDPPHFMALFKRTWFNHYTDLANEDSKRRKREAPILARMDDEGEEMRIAEPVGETDNAGVLSTLIRQAPREVALILNIMLNAPQELLEVAFGGWNPHSPRKGQGSQKLNALLGFPPDYDSVGVFESYFRGSTPAQAVYIGSR